MADLTRLFHGAPDGLSFLDKLELRIPERTSLERGRAKVRDALRLGFAKLSAERLGATLTPHFFTQGSFAYRTLNRPASPPRQQKDLDDGTYLPMTLVQGAPPSIAADTFFALVDEILRALCKLEGWTFATRPTCARVCIAQDAHIDVPLYAIPDEQFDTLAKSARNNAKLALDEEFDFMDARRAGIDEWDALPSDQVMLAHREEGWKVSDPRKIHQWFLSAVDTYGEQLRRICRYLKAWRDFQGEPVGNLSSICLMVCVFEAYRTAEPGAIDRRDDRSLRYVAQRLPKLLEGPIANPAEPSEKLCARLTPEERRNAIAAATRLADDLVYALAAPTPEASIAALQRGFGSRIPDRPDLVRSETTTAASVRQTPAKAVAAPVVGRSISG